MTIATADSLALSQMPPLDSSPSSDSGTIRRMSANLAYSNPFMQVHFDDVVFPNGEHGRYSRVTAGTGLGVVAVPYANFRGLAYLGLVRQYRYPTGEFTLEFPRGGSDDLTLAEAARELVEETGLTYTSGHRLGTIRPDTGLLDTTIAVWQTSHVVDSLESLYREEETGASIEWYRLGELTGLIMNGKITCGITLASLTLIQASGRVVNLA